MKKLNPFIAPVLLLSFILAGMAYTEEKYVPSYTTHRSLVTRIDQATTMTISYNGDGSIDVVTQNELPQSSDKETLEGVGCTVTNNAIVIPNDNNTWWWVPFDAGASHPETIVERNVPKYVNCECEYSEAQDCCYVGQYNSFIFCAGVVCYSCKLWFTPDMKGPGVVVAATKVNYNGVNYQ